MTQRKGSNTYLVVGVLNAIPSHHFSQVQELVLNGWRLDKERDRIVLIGKLGLFGREFVNVEWHPFTIVIRMRAQSRDVKWSGNANKSRQYCGLQTHDGFIMLGTSITSTSKTSRLFSV
jgi:hypothetical protein